MNFGNRSILDFSLNNNLNPNLIVLNFVVLFKRSIGMIHSRRRSIKRKVCSWRI